jgi:hypothetical protein
VDKIRLLLRTNPVAILLLLMGTIFVFGWGMGQRPTYGTSLLQGVESNNALNAKSYILAIPFIALALISNAANFSSLRKKENNFKSKHVLAIDGILLTIGALLLWNAPAVRDTLSTFFH